MITIRDSFGIEPTLNMEQVWNIVNMQQRPQYKIWNRSPGHLEHWQNKDPEQEQIWNNFKEYGTQSVIFQTRPPVHIQKRNQNKDPEQIWNIFS